MNKPCEYCGCDLPQGVDKATRRIRSFHFERCEARPLDPFVLERQREARLQSEAQAMFDLLLRLRDTVEALDGTSAENERLVDEYRALVARIEK